MNQEIEFGELDIHLLFNKADDTTMARVEEYVGLDTWEPSVGPYEIETSDGCEEFETWSEFRSFILRRSGESHYVSWRKQRQTHRAHLYFSINEDGSLVVGFSDGFHSVEPAAKRLIELASRLEAVAGFVDWEGPPAASRNEFLARLSGCNYASIMKQNTRPEAADVDQLTFDSPPLEEVRVPSDDPAGLKVLNSLESVRERPGMYIGSPYEAGNQVVRELVANALDQHLRGKVSRIQVETGYDHVRVTDDGPGLMFNPNVMRYLTTIHTTASADSHAPHVHVGAHGVGLAVLNALASTMTVESWRAGAGQQVRFESGRQVGTFHILEGPNPDATKVSWSPDRRRVNLAAADGRVRRDLFDIVHLFPGLVIELNGERFCAPGGLLDYCTFHGGTPKWTQHDTLEFHVIEEVEGIQVQAAGLLSNREGDPKVFGFANGVSNLSGDHIDGLRSACSGRSGVCAVSVVMNDPEWAGPSRDRFAVPRVRDVVYEVVSQAMGK